MPAMKFTECVVIKMHITKNAYAIRRIYCNYIACN